MNNDQITYVDLFLRFRRLWKFILFNWKQTMACGILTSILFVVVGNARTPMYRATITFALEQPTSMSGLSGIANQFGFNLNATSGGLGGDNLLTLMKSRTIIEQILESKVTFKEDTSLFVNSYIDTSPNSESIKNSGVLPISLKNCKNKEQDSIMGIIYDEIINNLKIVKEDKRESIIIATYECHNPELSIEFIEQLCAKSSEFYMKTKMANFRQNIAKLEQRVDSVSAELQAAMVGYASSQDQNSFTVQSTAKVPAVQKQMKVTMLTTLYGELVKNLELSKTMAAREEPLITVIDRPHYPLRVRESKLKSAAIGGVLGVFLTLVFLGARAFIQDLNKQAAALKQEA